MASAASSILSCDRSTPPPFLDPSPTTSPRKSEPIPFQGVLKLFNYLKKIHEGEVDFVTIQGIYYSCSTLSFFFVIFTNYNHFDISLAIFNEISNSRDRRNLKYKLDYDEESELLIVKFPNPLHEALHMRLYHHYIFDKMGSNKQMWVNTGTTQYRAEIRGKTARKEPDSAGGPIPERHGLDKWPTLVVEVGYSESLGYLRRDMRRWFEISKHEVKIVLLIQWDGTRRRIVIERWEEQQQEIPVTRLVPSGSAMRPVRRQVITITREETGGTFNYVVTSGDLLLMFSLLFLRQPQGAEADIVVTVDDLKKWAEFCWAYVSI